MTIKDKLLAILEVLEKHQTRFQRTPLSEMEVDIPFEDAQGFVHDSCFMREVDFGALYEELGKVLVTP